MVIGGLHFPTFSQSVEERAERGYVNGYERSESATKG